MNGSYGGFYGMVERITQNWNGIFSYTVCIELPASTYYDRATFGAHSTVYDYATSMRIISVEFDESQLSACQSSVYPQMHNYYDRVVIPAPPTYTKPEPLPDFLLSLPKLSICYNGCNSFTSNLITMACGCKKHMCCDCKSIAADRYVCQHCGYYKPFPIIR